MPTSVPRISSPDSHRLYLTVTSFETARTHLPTFHSSYVLGRRKRSTILLIKTKQGKRWSEQDYDDAVKQGISTPDDINLANHQFRIWWRCGTFFFGDASMFPSALAKLINLMATHCITFEAQQIKDKNFFTKFAYQVDTGVFRWLQQCAQESDK